MRQYRKKPVVIEAVQINSENVEWVAEWCGGEVISRSFTPDNDETYYGIDINTLEGVMSGLDRYWIIKGVQGEFYPCKPDIFEATYEPEGLVLKNET